jgi:hypothetical protein
MRGSLEGEDRNWGDELVIRSEKEQAGIDDYILTSMIVC